MTINNLRVSELSSQIRQQAERLNWLQREGHSDALIHTLKAIKKAAQQAEELMEWRQS